MHIHQLEYLIIISQEKNLSRAAEKCFLTESTLCQFVMKLERSCGAKIFLRNKNVMTPTTLGVLYIDTAKRIVDLYDHLQVEVEQYKSYHSRNIMFGMTTERSDRIFPYIYSQFHSQYPEVMLHLVNDRYHRNLKKLSEQKLDFVLAAIPPDYNLPILDQFGSVPVFTEELVLIMPPESPLALYYKDHPDEKVPLTALNGENFIGYENDMMLHLYIHSTFDRLKIKPNEISRVGSHYVCSEFVKNGVGLALIPRYLIPENSPVYKVSTEPQLYWEHTLFYPKQHELTALEKRLIQMTAESFSASSDAGG